MKISVLIPTYKRPENLAKILPSLRAQTRPAEQIIIVVRDSDPDTLRYLEEATIVRELPILRVVAPEVGGVCAAMNAGVKAVTGDVMTLTDDDAIPHLDWLEKIEAHYEVDARVVGVGGIDLQPNIPPQLGVVVGILQWYGRTVGNHHVGTGSAREVDFLKGVNCSYRASALKSIGFDMRLYGKGAQVHFELILGLALRRAGWKIIYDPAVTLDHYPAVRFDDDQRGVYNVQAHFDLVHNGTLAVYEHLSPVPRIAFVAWAFLIGTRIEPGLFMALYLLIKDYRAAQRVVPTLRGRLAGIRTARRTKRPEVSPPGSETTSSVPPALATRR